MGNFQGGNRGGGGGFRGGNGGGRPSFQKKSWGGNDRGGDRSNNEMHKAVCSECGKGCEVPFRPSSDKPVYCNDCFSSKREGVDRKPRAEFNDRGPKRDFDRPAPRPAFTPAGNGDAEVKNQLRDISVKLDRLIGAMEKLSGTTKPVTTPAPKVAPAPVKMEAKKEVKKVPTLKAMVKKAVAKAPIKKVAVKKPVSKKKK